MVVWFDSVRLREGGAEFEIERNEPDAEAGIPPSRFEKLEGDRLASRFCELTRRDCE